MNGRGTNIWEKGENYSLVHTFFRIFFCFLLKIYLIECVYFFFLPDALQFSKFHLFFNIWSIIRHRESHLRILGAWNLTKERRGSHADQTETGCFSHLCRLRVRSEASWKGIASDKRAATFHAKLDTIIRGTRRILILTSGFDALEYKKSAATATALIPWDCLVASTSLRKNKTTNPPTSTSYESCFTTRIFDFRGFSAQFCVFSRQKFQRFYW